MIEPDWLLLELWLRKLEYRRNYHPIDDLILKELHDRQDRTIQTITN